MIRIRLFLFFVGGLCLATTAGPAAAQSFALRQGYSADSTKVVTEARVPYADIDVASSAGARVLLERIESAADAVCGGAANAVTEHQKADYRECRRAAISGAVARMRSRALSELAASRQARPRAAR